MRFRYRIPESCIAGAVDFISGLGFAASRQPSVTVLRREGISVSIYSTGTVLCELGKDQYSRTLMHYFENFDFDYTAYAEAAVGLKLSGNWIGTDEAGKGDYFGPLVVAGVCVDAEAAARLFRHGVSDSKRLAESEIQKLARLIESLIPADGIEVISISPETFNRMYDSMQNINDILMWAHRKVILNLSRKNNCRTAVVDRFFPESRKGELQSSITGVEVIPLTRGEREIAVAAASVIASAVFTRGLLRLRTLAGTMLPPGAGSEARSIFNSILREKGMDFLRRVAKSSFRS
jgi:ribonuclease HIII